MRGVVVSDVCGRSAGAYQSTLLLCQELSRQGVEVTCFATTVERQWISAADHFRIVEPILRRGSRWDWPTRCLAVQAARHIERDSPDVVFVVGLNRLCGYLLKTSVAGRMLVIELTNATPGNKFVDDAAVRFLGRCRAMVSPASAIDRHIRDTYRYEGPIDRMQFWVDDLGVGPPEERVGVSTDFLYLGRLDEEKGLRDLLRATESLVKQRDRVRVTIAGPGPHEPYETFATDLGVQDSVAFLPVLSPQEVRDELARSRFLVLPSHHEGYPLVLLEAAQAGVPFVATRVGAIPEMFESNGGCVLVEPGDPSRIAQAMVRLLGEPREAYEQRRQAIYRGFKDLASSATVSSSVGDLLEKYAVTRGET